ncbi:hypothetical protein [Nostoc sp.]|uniref:hypothetical protein n=1 Tax=Nostoc sp. TaxID=1180 RepID=UPI002FF8D94B
MPKYCDIKDKCRDVNDEHGDVNDEHGDVNDEHCDIDRYMLLIRNCDVYDGLRQSNIYSNSVIS